MIRYIVYESHTDFTKRYAELISLKFKLPSISLDDAKSKVYEGDSILYMGWIRAGKIMGFKKAMSGYNVEAVIAVGIATPSDDMKAILKEKNKIPDIPLFYLQGGITPNRIAGVDKVLFNMISRIALLRAEKNKESLTEADKLTLSILQKGGDCINPDNLQALFDWYSSYLMIQSVLNRKFKKPRY
jgi:hypothetical protein